MLKILAIIIGSILAGSAGVRAGEVLDRIIAVVNDEIITQSEFNTLAQPVLAEAQDSLSAGEYLKQEATIKNQVLDAIIDERLMMKKAAEIGLTVNDDEINERLNELKQENNIADDEQFSKILEQEGLTLDQLREQMKRHITMLKLRAREVQYKVDVTEADARKYYEDHSIDYKTPRKAHVQLLVVELPIAANESDKAAKIAEAQKIRSRLSAGEDFTKLVKEVMPHAADNAGDIGWLEAGKMLPEFEQRVFTQNVGEISEPFETSHGINLIKVIERQDESFVPFEQVQEPIIEKLRQIRLESRMRDWLDELRTTAFIQKKAEP